MEAVLLTGVDHQLAARLRAPLDGAEHLEVRRIERAEDVLFHLLAVDPALIRAVVIGPAVESPLRLAQAVHRADREIGVLMLTQPADLPRLRQELLITPFLGNNVVCCSSAEPAEVGATLEQLVESSRQRRRYRATVAAMNERLATATPFRAHAQHYLDSLLDHLPIGVVAVDARGVMLDWNRKAAEILGQDLAARDDGSIVEVLGGQEAGDLLPVLLGRNGVRPEVVTRTITRPGAGGERQYVEVTVTGLAGAVDDVHALVLLEDVTAREKVSRDLAAALKMRDRLLRRESAAHAATETARRRVDFLSEASVILSGSLDPEQVLREIVSLAAGTVAGSCVIHLIDRDGALELKAAATAPDEDAPPTAAAFPQPDLAAYLRRVIETGQPWTVAPAPDAEETGAALIVAPLVARDRMLGVLSMTPRRRPPSGVILDLDLVLDLSRRVALALDNARLYREARDAIRQREEFLSIASHELKTPLTAVKGNLQLLVHRVQNSAAASLAPEPLLALTERMELQVERLENLVADLLDASRIQQGRLHLRPERVDLVDLVRQVVTRFEQAPEWTERHHVRIDGPDQLIGVWDPSRLDQVVTNLLSNALKYSPGGGEVRIALREADGWVTLVVRDEGIGIRPEEIDGLFQPFVRGVATSRSIYGVGLGLYITARIVERHGGAISVRSELGAGSTFTVRLPTRPPLPPDE